MKRTTTLICLLLALIMPLNLVGCTKTQAADLMDGITPKKVTEKETDSEFIAQQLDLYFDLFKAIAAEDKANDETDSLLVSPMSIVLALAMTANGADGQTKSEMQSLLGGEKTIEELNEYLYSYVNNLPSDKKSKLELANSIWFRDDADKLIVEKEFLQKNADYYSASAYKSPFDENTVNDINNWVKKHTDGMIDEIIESIDPLAIMYLINAVTFDAEWLVPYEKMDVSTGRFTDYYGETSNAEMMCSTENRYIHDDQTTGFIKNYSGSNYSFVALLPSEGIDVYDYINNLDGEKFSSLMNSKEQDSVFATMPKFSYDYDITMNDVLKSLGMPSAFSPYEADFSKLGTSPLGNIYINNVLHKTFISVDELGTRAGAATAVELRAEGAMMTEKTVCLDRPFVYAIVDNATSLPIFIGAVTELD